MMVLRSAEPPAVVSISTGELRLYLAGRRMMTPWMSQIENKNDNLGKRHIRKEMRTKC